MTEVRRSALVAVSAERVYAVVDDVAAYPSFLPWCTASTVHSDEDGVMEASLSVARGPLDATFRTRNQRRAPAASGPGSIRMDLVEGPFEALTGTWDFEPLGQDGADGCKVSLVLSFAFGNELLAAGLNPVFAGIADSMVDAFVARARAEAGA